MTIEHPPVFIIAEIGVNHNGSLAMATKMVDVAADARVDAVKFQGFSAERLVTPSAAKADYQLEKTDRGETQFEMLSRLELTKADFLALRDHAVTRGVEFLMTPFDLDYVEFINSDLGLSRYKLGSGSLTNGPMLLQAARTGKPVVLSTGLSTLDQIGTALSVLAFGYVAGPNEMPSAEILRTDYAPKDHTALLRDKVTLLHCTSEYPADLDDVNLRAMNTIQQAFEVPVGYSDHSLGTVVPALAVAAGAVVIEKHMTLDRDLDGPDHAASVLPHEMAEIVASIRRTETLLGSPLKQPTAKELKNEYVVHQSLIAARDIMAGEPLSEDNMVVMRPGGGVSPMQYWDWLGKPASRGFSKFEKIE